MKTTKVPFPTPTLAAQIARRELVRLPQGPYVEDIRRSTPAYRVCQLVQEMAKCDFTAARLAVQDVMPELFADYWCEWLKAHAFTASSDQATNGVSTSGIHPVNSSVDTLAIDTQA